MSKLKVKKRSPVPKKCAMKAKGNAEVTLHSSLSMVPVGKSHTCYFSPWSHFIYKGEGKSSNISMGIKSCLSNCFNDKLFYLLYWCTFTEFYNLHVLVGIMDHAQILHPLEPMRDVCCQISSKQLCSQRV